MKFKELKKQIKEEQKQLAKQIRRSKLLRKPKNRVDLSEDDYKIAYWKTHGGEYRYYDRTTSLSDAYRITHVAYCSFFNKTPYEKIESNCKERLRDSTIESYHKEWEKILNETLCDCAA